LLDSLLQEIQIVNFEMEGHSYRWRDIRWTCVNDVLELSKSPKYQDVTIICEAGKLQINSFLLASVFPIVKDLLEPSSEEMFISLPEIDCRNLFSFFNSIFCQKDEIKVCKEIYDLLSIGPLENCEISDEAYEEEIAKNDLFCDFQMEDLEVGSKDTKVQNQEMMPIEILKVEHIDSEVEDNQEPNKDVQESPKEESITEEEDLFIKEEVTEPDDDDFIDGPDDVIEELRAVGGGGLPLLLPRPNKSSETDDDGKTTVTPLKYNKKKRNTGRKKLKEKMIEIEDDEEGRCDQCYKTFKNIKRHMLTHEAPQIFYCPKCDFNTPRKYTLIRHERTYKGHMKNGKCRRCQLRVPPHAEADHKCIILCNVCGKTFPTWKILTAHYHEVHGINMIKKAEGRKKIVRCGACKIKLNPGEEDDHRCVFWC